MSTPRRIEPKVTYLVTRRVILRHMLFSPSPQMNQILRYLLAIIADHHGVQVHAFCVMSTHVHLVVTDVRGTLPKFLHAFHRTVALCVKALLQWDDVVWDKSPTSAVRLETPAAVVEKIAYVIANPVTAGLVSRAYEWPGATVTADDVGQGSIRARRPEVYLNPKNPLWTEEAALLITLPPGVEPADGDAFRRQVAAEVARLDGSAHAQMEEEGRTFLGVEAVLAVPHTARATSEEPRVDRNPSFATGRNQGEALHRAAAAMHAFRATYRSALTRWRSGERDTVFPPGTWWMRVFHGATVHDGVAPL
jgi:putative transposase